MGLQRVRNDLVIEQQQWSVLLVQFYSVAQSCPTLCDPMNCSPAGSSIPWDFPGKSTGVGCHRQYSGLISFWIDCFNLFDVKGLLRAFFKPQFEGIDSLALSLLHGPTLTSVHDYWKNHSFDYTDFCRQKDVSAF